MPSGVKRIGTDPGCCSGACLHACGAGQVYNVLFFPQRFIFDVQLGHHHSHYVSACTTKRGEARLLVQSSNAQVGEEGACWCREATCASSRRFSAARALVSSSSCLIFLRNTASCCPRSKATCWTLTSSSCWTPQSSCQTHHSFTRRIRISCLQALAEFFFFGN